MNLISKDGENMNGLEHLPYATVTNERLEREQERRKEQKAKKSAYNRHRWAMFTDEEREKKKVREKNRLVKNSDDAKARRNAYYRHRRALQTDEERERERACQRIKHANRTDEQKEKLKAYRRHRQATCTNEERMKRGALYREKRANWTIEQKERYNAGRLCYYHENKKQKISPGRSLSKSSNKQEKVIGDTKRPTDEYEVNFVDFNQQQQIILGEKQPECSYVPGSKCTVKLKQSVVDNDSNFVTDCVKSINVMNEQYTSSMGGLDYFEECEDWKIHIKKE